MTMNDGGPAFAHGNPTQGGDPGMTLRDWFAGQALAGIINDSVRRETDVVNNMAHGVRGGKFDAQAAYAWADAMLAARKNSKGGGA